MFGVSWLKHLQHIMRHLKRDEPAVLLLLLCSYYMYGNVKYIVDRSTCVKPCICCNMANSHRRFPGHNNHPPHHNSQQKHSQCPPDHRLALHQPHPLPPPPRRHNRLR